MNDVVSDFLTIHSSCVQYRVQSVYTPRDQTKTAMGILCTHGVWRCGAKIETLEFGRGKYGRFSIAL